MSDTTKRNLNQKLVEIHNKLKPVVKDRTNPHFKNRYAHIDSVIAAVKPLCVEYGVVWTQPLDIRDGRNVILNIVADADSGERQEFASYLPNIEDPQKFVSAVTYYRRATAVPLWLVEGAEDDDDGNTAAAPARHFDHRTSIAKLNATRSLDELKTVWASLSPVAMNDIGVQSAKEAMKFALTDDSVDADA